MEDKLIATLPGMRDLLPEDIAHWHLVEDRARRIFTQYGFQEIRTPIMEATELFARGIGDETDIVGKEMYTFKDQSGRSVSLRPENTAPVVRAFAQHAMYRGGGLTKLYYIGPMFRHEKKQMGRWRQFYQIGAEALGSDNPAIEAEVVEMLLALLSSLGVEGRLLLNSVGCANCRPEYIRLLRSQLQLHREDLCEDCTRRAESNALRVLDCKVASCQPVIAVLPRITDHLCGACGDHFERLKVHLSEGGISFEIIPRLVRGLDYYVRTAFEIVSGGLGAQNALVGGGRYDGLSEVLGGPRAQGFGFAMGLDRLVMILPEHVKSGSGYRPEVYIAHLGEMAFRQGIAVARSLRQLGVVCHLEFAGGSLKSQLRQANRLGARQVIIIGEEEMARGRYIIRRMEDSVQREATLPELLTELGTRGPESAASC